MTATLPPLPDRALLSDLCREAAAREKFQPQLVEKDFYLTRILWGLGQRFGEGMLLKGGTLLGKVDLGYFRISEDADLVLPGTPGHHRLDNVRRMHKVRDALKDIAPLAGVTPRFPAGLLSERGAHGLWQLDYPSEFGPQGVLLEVTIRPVLQRHRKVSLRQLLDDSLAGDVADAKCFALDRDEARAEKVRAAFTRDAIRDFYDLERLLEKGSDFTSTEFVALVDAKLGEIDEAPLAKQVKPFALTPRRRRLLEAAIDGELLRVLRADAPRFNLACMLAQFEGLWRGTD